MRKAGWMLLCVLLASACAPPKAQDLWKGRKPGLWRLTTHSTATTDSVADQCVAQQTGDVLDVPVAFPPGCKGPINFDLKDRKWEFAMTCPMAPHVTALFSGKVSGNFQDSYEIRMSVSNPDAPPTDKPVIQTTQAVRISDQCDAGSPTQ